MTTNTPNPRKALNSRQEAFCRGLAEGLSQSAAYVRAGYKPRGPVADAEASRMVRNPKVVLRLSELRREAAYRSTKTVASLVEGLDRALAIAQEDRNPNAMVAAIVAQGKLLGLVVDKAQIETKAHRPAPEPDVAAGVLMTEGEWEERLRRH